MGQQYLSPQQGRVPILSLWDRHPGGQSSFRTSIIILDFTKTPLALLPPISREQEFSQDTDPPGGHSTIPMRCHRNLKPGTSVGLCCWKAITHAYEHIYPPGPREQEFSWDTDPREVNGASIPITTTGSRPNLNPLG